LAGEEAFIEMEIVDGRLAINGANLFGTVVAPAISRISLNTPVLSAMAFPWEGDTASHNLKRAINQTGLNSGHVLEKQKARSDRLGFSLN
jgi:hypothetical protein